MPQINDIKSAKELGYKASSSKYVYLPCPNCGIPRWVRAGRNKLCVKCARADYLERRGSGDIERAILAGEAKLDANGIVLYKHNCRVCGKEIWHQKRDIYRTCSLECAKTIRAKWDKSPKWRGGHRMASGYIETRVKSSDPYFSMARGGYVMEHRLVMARHLGRCLEPWEIVHHLNGVKLDNRIENLELLPNQTNHVPSIVAQRQINSLKKRVTKLETENSKLKADLELLKWHMRDIRHDIDNTEPSKSPDGVLGVCRDYGPSTLPKEGSDIVRSSWKQE